MQARLDELRHDKNQGEMLAPPTAQPTRWRGLGFSFAGALCSAAYLFPYNGRPSSRTTLVV